MHVESAYCTKISIYLANFHALSLSALLSRSEVLLSPLRASEPGINAWSLHTAAASFYFAFFSWIVALNLECRLLRLEMVLAPTEEGHLIPMPTRGHLPFSPASGWLWPNLVLSLRILLSVPQLPWSLGKQSANNLEVGPPSSFFFPPVTDMRPW